MRVGRCVVWALGMSAVLACGGAGADGGSTAPTDPSAAFMGPWNLATVNSTPLPVEIDVSATASTPAYVLRVYKESLLLVAGGSHLAQWSDSTTLATPGGTPQNTSVVFTQLQWALNATHDTLTVSAAPGATTGLYFHRTFIRAADGALQATDAFDGSGLVELFR